MYTRDTDGAILVMGTLLQTCPCWRCRNGANLNNQVGGNSNHFSFRMSTGKCLRAVAPVPGCRSNGHRPLPFAATAPSATNRATLGKLSLAPVCANEWRICWHLLSDASCHRYGGHQNDVPIVHAPLPRAGATFTACGKNGVP